MPFESNCIKYIFSLVDIFMRFLDRFLFWPFEFRGQKWDEQVKPKRGH